MIRVLVLSALLILGGAVLFHLIKDDPGYVLISVFGTEILTSFWLAVTLVILAALALWFLFSLLFSFSKTMGKLTSWFGSVGRKRAENRFYRGFINYVEGDWRRAKRDFLASASNLQRNGEDEKFVPYLASSQCALELHEVDEAGFLLDKITDEKNKNSLAVLIQKNRLLMAQNKYAESESSLSSALTQYPDNVVLIELMSQIYLAREEWDKLIKLLPKLRNASIKNGQASQADIDALFVDAHIHMLHEAQKPSLESASNKSQAQQNLNKLWSDFSSSAKQDPKIAAHYVAIANEGGDTTSAEKTCRKLLNSQYDEKLAYIYGKIRLSDSDQQLSFAKKWLDKYGEKDALLLTLGRISERLELWGRARDYYLAALKIGASAEIYLRLAVVHERLGDDAKAKEFYRQGLELAV